MVKDVQSMVDARGYTLELNGLFNVKSLCGNYIDILPGKIQNMLEGLSNVCLTISARHHAKCLMKFNTGTYQDNKWEMSQSCILCVYL